MSKLDLHLRHLLELRANDGAGRMHELAAAAHEPVFFSEEAPDPGNDNPEVSLIVRFDGDVAALKGAGMDVDTVAGNIATGSIRIADLPNLENVSGIDVAESALQVKTSLNLSLSEILADQVHIGPPGLRGQGVVVGIVDSGIDFTNPVFQNNTGGTRIKSIWDQNLTAQAGESSPSGFSYGVEYDDTAIDSAIGTANPFNTVRAQPGSHGTHVAGIAAGDGSVAGNGQPADTYVGVAPEATIVGVATDFSTSGVIDAVNYVFQVAQSLGLPAVVNLSLGSVIGPHDGTSTFEQGLTNLVTGNGRVIVAAAGNEGGDNAHASGAVAAGTTLNLTVNVPNNRQAPVILDLWYDGGSTFGVNLTDPSGNTTGNVAVGNTFNGTWNGAPVAIQHVNNDANNGDKRVIFILSPPAGGGNVPNGAWQLQLQGNAVAAGTYDTWISTPNGQPVASFPAAQATAVGTVAQPATANRVISVGSYITSGAGVGNISTFSNWGPTRDGRASPDITAPGQRITSAALMSTGDAYTGSSGTSMASPQIAGVVALMLEQNSSRDWQAIRDCLANTARTDAFTGATPNNTWGPGKVDALAATSCGVVSPLVTRLPPCIITRTPPCLPTRTPPCLPTRTPPCLPTRTPPCPPTRVPPCIITRPPACLPTRVPPCGTTRPPICIPTRVPPCVVTRPPGCITTRPPTCFTTRPPTCVTTRPPSCLTTRPPTCFVTRPPACGGVPTREPSCIITRGSCPSRVDACPTRGICRPPIDRPPVERPPVGRPPVGRPPFGGTPFPGMPRAQEHEVDEQDLSAYEFESGFAAGYEYAYAEFYGTMEESGCESGCSGDCESYDSDWFDPNEFE